MNRRTLEKIREEELMLEPEEDEDYEEAINARIEGDEVTADLAGFEWGYRRAA